MQHTPNTLAVWLSMMEPLFFREHDRAGLFIIVLAGTPVATYAHTHFHESELIMVSSVRELPYPTFDQLLFETDLAEKLHERSITHLAVPYRTKKEYREWARKNKITLITPPARIQTRLENKRVFQRLLRKHAVHTPPTLSTPAHMLPTKTYVIQESTGSGMQGTVFLQAGSVPPASLTKSVLVREYVPGTPIGVSIIIDHAGHAVFSAIRRQCFLYENDFPNIFLGIQWLPTNYFSDEALRSLQGELLKTSALLHATKFAGMANIDFIVSNERAYVLECNPRLSAATPQLFSTNGLTPHKEPWRLYTRACVRDTLGTTQKEEAHIPSSHYEGATLDIDVPAYTDVSKIPMVGTYQLTARGISHIADEQHIPSGLDTFFLFHDLSVPHARIEEEFTLATIFSDSPLYDPITGSLNARGLSIRSAVSALFM